MTHELSLCGGKTTRCRASGKDCADRRTTQVMQRTMEGWEDLQCFGWNTII